MYKNVKLDHLQLRQTPTQLADDLVQLAEVVTPLACLGLGTILIFALIILLVRVDEIDVVDDEALGYFWGAVAERDDSEYTIWKCFA